MSKFVYSVTPRGLQTQLANSAEEAVRSLARSLNYTEVYGLRSVVVDSTNMIASAPEPPSFGDLAADSENPLHGVEMGMSTSLATHE